MAGYYSSIVDIERIIFLLEKSTAIMPPTLVENIKKIYGDDPFLVLISCLLGLRTTDIQTFKVCEVLFKQAKTPSEFLNLPTPTLEHILRPLGFYKKKSILLHEVSETILKTFKGKVPADLDQLLSIKGVGRKTANLVLSQAFGIPAICVDTHVHRITNRLGWVKTKTPEETEIALSKIIPEKYWINLNQLLVKWGQNVCRPRLPKCTTCVLEPYCPKIGVTTHR